MPRKKQEVKYSRLYRCAPDSQEYMIFSEDPLVICELYDDPDCELVKWIDGKNAARFRVTFDSWRAAKRRFRRLTGWLGLRINFGETVTAFTYFPRISFRKSA